VQTEEATTRNWRDETVEGRLTALEDRVADLMKRLNGEINEIAENLISRGATPGESLLPFDLKAISSRIDYLQAEAEALKGMLLSLLSEQGGQDADTPGDDDSTEESEPA
jgi:hypothetical protein